MHQVYIDATIPSYLVARQSRDRTTAERQRITPEFWNETRFELILSTYVVDEISIGDRVRVDERRLAVAGLTVVVVQEFDQMLARQLVNQKAIPEGAFTDAVHVAVAAIRAIPYVATWNFAHLANPHTRPNIEQVCRDAGYSPPRIDTPQAIMEEN